MTVPGFTFCFAIAAALFLSPGSARAQALFRNVTAANLPQAAGLHSLDAEFGDVDKDGDLDILIAVENGANRLYLNDGKAKFAWKQNAFSSASADGEDLAVEDFDRDGNLDAVFVMEDGGVHQYYLGNGDGSFRNVSERIPSCVGNGVEAADVDGDGWKDVLIACAGGGPGAQDLLLINDKQGGFRNETAKRLPALTESSQDVKAADLDGDGDLDVVVGNDAGKNRLLFNKGDGTFTDAAANLPIPYEEETREVLLVDVDGDGDKDIVFCNLTCNACATYTRNPQARLLINDGKGRFTDETAARMPPNTFSSWDGGYLDFDADGDQDLILCAITVPGFTGLDAKAYRNDGTGTFTDVTATVMPAGASGRLWDVETADLDRDGTLDVFMGAWGTQAILILGTVDQPAAIRKRDAPPAKAGGRKRSRAKSGPGRAAGFLFAWEDRETLSDGRVPAPGR
ncbi:MAG TPA: VCBS repeat-containing protein [Fibrobacteria bacterium]|nr:VCBS repeat-containing protein [Fibrobacteria bacterium]